MQSTRRNHNPIVIDNPNKTDVIARLYIDGNKLTIYYRAFHCNEWRSPLLDALGQRDAFKDTHIALFGSKEDTDLDHDQEKDHYHFNDFEFRVAHVHFIFVTKENHRPFSIESSDAIRAIIRAINQLQKTPFTKDAHQLNLYSKIAGFFGNPNGCVTTKLLSNIEKIKRLSDDALTFRNQYLKKHDKTGDLCFWVNKEIIKFSPASPTLCSNVLTPILPRGPLLRENTENAVNEGCNIAVGAMVSVPLLLSCCYFFKKIKPSKPRAIHTETQQHAPQR